MKKTNCGTVANLALTLQGHFRMQYFIITEKYFVCEGERSVDS